MSNVRELSLDEIMLISGGGNGGDHDRSSYGARNTLGRNAPTHIYSDPKTVACANGVFGGLVGGISKGPVGMATGVIGGAIKGNCLSSGSSRSDNGCNSKSGNCSSGGGFGSQCNRP